jgi:hypothetical protein
MEGFAAGSTEGEGLVVSSGSPLEQAAMNAKNTVARMAWRTGLRVKALMMSSDLRRLHGSDSDAFVDRRTVGTVPEGCKHSIER